MNHKCQTIKGCILAIVVMIGGLMFGTQCVHASVADTVAAQSYSRTVEVSQAYINKYGFTNAFYRTIEQANTMSPLENAQEPVKVTMPAGVYEISNPIQINYSNLTVDFTGCTFVQKKDNVGNLLRIG